jgi:anti-sigma regulatory factor (Ser/Thr protein kinase)
MHEMELPRAKHAARDARQQISQWFGTELDESTLNAAKLLASELINNSVLHGQGTITLRAGLDEDRLLVEVIDEGSGFERVVKDRDFDAVGGRGLHIVDAEASRWGIHEGTTHVWFELERTGPRIGEREKPADL